MSSNSTASRGAVTQCCGSRMLFAAAMTSFVFSILAILVFLCLRFLMLCRRGRPGARPHVQEQHRPKPGLDAAAIALLPSFPYRRGDTDAEAECAVCLGVLNEGRMVRQLHGCMHVFHRRCVDVWLASNASCPVCRRKAEPAPAEEGAAASLVHVAAAETLNDDASVATTSSTPTGTEIRVLWTRLEAGSCLA